MRNWKKKLALGLIAFCLMAGVTFSAFAADEGIYEIKTGIHSKEYTYSELMTYRQENAYTEPSTSKTDDTYVFAGWYKTQECNSKDVLTAEAIQALDATESANSKFYAKFVSGEVLNVRAQLLGGTDSTFTSTTMRFVTTVDSLDYEKVGFDLILDGTSYNAESDKVYDKLLYVGSTSNETMEYEPQKEFHESSLYFMAANLKNISAEDFEKDVTITPYWVTLDGTRVENTGEFKKSVMLGITKSCEALVTDADSTESKYYSTLEKAFELGEDNAHTYLSDNDTVTIIQGKVDLDSTLKVYSNVTLTNKEDLSVTITRTMTSSQFIDNYATEFTVKGTEQGQLTFDGTYKVDDELKQSTSGCIESDDTATQKLKLENILFKNMYTSRTGGVVRANGFVNITNCVFNNNTQVNATSDSKGTVIYYNGKSVESQSELTVKGCTFSSNKAEATGGGTIFINQGVDVTVSNCEFTKNIAHGGGGAIYVSNGSVETSGCTFTGNSTYSYANGGAIYVANGTYTDSGSTFSGNNGNHGGAVRLDKNITSASFTNSKFEGNYTHKATKNYNGGALNIQETTGEITITGVEFTSNIANYQGGAIYTAATNLTISGCTFKGNANRVNDDGTLYISGASGNAVYATQALTFKSNIYDGQVVGDFAGTGFDGVNL